VGLATIFYCLRFETSVFIASYDSQSYGGGIRVRLHTGLITRIFPTQYTHKYSSYLTGIASRLPFEDQLDNAVYGKQLLIVLRTTQNANEGRMYSSIMLKRVVHIVTTGT
jgi:hypothetical protein